MSVLIFTSRHCVQRVKLQFPRRKTRPWSWEGVRCPRKFNQNCFCLDLAVSVFDRFTAAVLPINWSLFLYNYTGKYNISKFVYYVCGCFFMDSLVSVGFCVPFRFVDENLTNAASSIYSFKFESFKLFSHMYEGGANIKETLKINLLWEYWNNQTKSYLIFLHTFHYVPNCSWNK